MGKKSKIPNQSLPNNPKGNKILSIDIPVNEEKKSGYRHYLSKFS